MCHQSLLPMLCRAGSTRLTWTCCGRHLAQYCLVIAPLSQVEMQQTEQDVLWRVLARGQGAAATGDAAALAEYFNLGVCLAERAAVWATRDERFSQLRPFFPGGPMQTARVPMHTGRVPG